MKRKPSDPAASAEPADRWAPARLLERAADFYHRTLLENPQAFDWLRERGLNDSDLLGATRLGWCEGRLPEILPDDEGILRSLCALGLLTDREGARVEALADHLVVPVLDDVGGVQGLWGIQPADGSTRATVGCPAFWNLPAAGRFGRLFLAGTVLDGLAVLRSGRPNVVALTGHRPEEDGLRVLRAGGVREVEIIHAQGSVEPIAFPGLQTSVLGLPDAPLALLRAHGPEGLAKAIDGAARRPLNAAVKATESEAIEGGVAVRFGGRRYELLGITRSRNQLKATVRIEHDGRLFVDTADFYSSRARKRLAASLCAELNQAAHVVEADLDRVIRLLERRRGEPPAAEPAGYRMSEEERNEALAFGRCPDLIERILDDFAACGVVGEQNNKLLCYLAAVSRKLADPISVLILSSSGAGKSMLQDKVLSLCPPEDVVRLTSLTGRALYYKGRFSLRHKILALEEAAGAEHASYAIRNLISAGSLVIETAVREQGTGHLVTVQNRVDGPTAVFVTTTDPDLDPETASRFFVTGVDESREQTRAILEAQRQRAAASPSAMEGLLRRHHNFQRLLQPLRVVNPLAGQLQYADDRLQSRREQPRLLGLINAVTLLRQLGREVRMDEKGPILETCREDVAIAHGVVSALYGQRIDELNRVSRDLLGQIRAMVEGLAHQSDAKPGEVAFTRRQIRMHTGWSASRVHRYLRQLVELEYLSSRRHSWGACEYRLAYEGQGDGGAPFLMGFSLPEVKA